MSNPVAQFEGKFADKIGTKYAIAVNSGTSALHAALVACDVRGGEVIMPALCPAMDAFAIIHAGAKSVFADVDPKTHLVTYETVFPIINDKTRAIIAVALHGLPVDMTKLMSFKELVSMKNIFVIEDCAQALFAHYENTYAGVKADIGCFSFEKKKHLTTGSEGGMIITNNADLATRARKFAGIGYKHMTAEAGRTSLDASVYQRPDYERFDTIGLNYRLSESQAEIGLEKLKFIDTVLNQRREVAFRWQRALETEFQPHDYNADNSFYSAAFDYQGDDWLGVYNRFVAAGGDGFYAMPQCPYNEPALSLLKFQNPIAESLQKRLMLFKTHYKTIAHAQRQCDILQSIL